MTGMDTETIETAIQQIDRLRKLLKKGRGPQVRSGEERSIVKATGLSWFHSHRANLGQIEAHEQGPKLDHAYKSLIELSERQTSRSVYDPILKAARADLIKLRSAMLAQATVVMATTDQPVSFQTLTADARMQSVLSSRWNECVLCLQAEAPLAATVMMGGLLEALLLARVNLEADKSAVFQAQAAPRNDQQKPRPLKEWALKNYIEVAHELGWISVSAKDVGEVLRDYRNYIHPSKQYSHNVSLTTEDAAILWEVAKAIARQLLKA
ncbi:MULTISPECIES: hypothetical protein [Luteibacter]|uniref:hypothetical protein n=1 Tax=Luteibacter TaxID=242605 RepID=UPI00068924A1|nr:MULTISPECIES: hypothetical protein [unclassified Luteibacter]